MLSFFDAYCALGPVSAPLFGQEFMTAARLLETIAEVGIGEVLVYSPAAYEYEVNSGNEALMAAIAGHSRLHPCWVLAPAATGDMPPPGRLLAAMAANNVRAARLCPGAGRNNFSLEPWCAGPLLEALAEARVPVFLDLVEVTWPEVASLLARYQRLPVVLTGVTYRLDRYLYPLWEAHHHLYVEISGYQGYQAIEAVVNRFGPERLIFGTHMPVFTPGAVLAALTYADIPAGARAAIAAGNLRRLLEAAYAG